MDIIPIITTAQVLIILILSIINYIFSETIREVKEENKRLTRSIGIQEQSISNADATIKELHEILDGQEKAIETCNIALRSIDCN